MADCEDYANWDNLDEDERAATLEEAVNKELTEAGYEPVYVRHAPIDVLGQGNARGITLKDSYLREAGRNDAYSTVFHEAWHTMDGQDGVYDRMTEDEHEEFFYRDFTREKFIDPWDELRSYDSYEMPDHDMAEAFGQAMADEIAEECVGPPRHPPRPPPSPESGADTLDFGDINWDAGAGPDDSVDAGDEFEFEMDEAGVVVTDESANEGDEFEFEMDEAGVVVTDDYSASELDDLEGPGYEEDFEETPSDFQKKITDMNLEIDIEEGAISPDNSENESDEAEAEVAEYNVVILGN